MAWEVIWEPKGVWRRFSGTLSLQDVISAIKAVQADPRYDSLRYAINDYTAVEELIHREDLVRGLDDILGQVIGGSFTNNNLVTAIVATQPEIIALSQGFLGGTLPYPATLCATTEAGRAWIEAELGGSSGGAAG